MTYECKVMVGPPGCGKTTLVEKLVAQLEEEHNTTAVISRDFVRKSFVGEVDTNDTDAYFAQENKVFSEFIRQINEAMELGINYVFVDATHVSPGSRAKLLRQLRPDPSTKLTFEVLKCSLDTCLVRNAMRTGFARVPDSAIRSMYRGFKPPTQEEFIYNKYGFKSVSINYHNTEVSK